MHEEWDVFTGFLSCTDQELALASSCRNLPRVVIDLSGVRDVTPRLLLRGKRETGCVQEHEQTGSWGLVPPPGEREEYLVSGQGTKSNMPREGQT